MVLMKTKLLKILSCKTIILCFAISSQVYAITKPQLKYDFRQNKKGMKVQACLHNHGNQEILWLLPSMVEQNKDQSFEVITDTKKYVKPKYDYIETSSNTQKTCITYTLENYKGWYNQYFQDISEDSFLIFGHYISLIIPESIFDNNEKIDVAFNWHNFTKDVISNLDDINHKKQYSLTLKEFETLYFAKGYETLYTDKSKKNKWIYPEKHHKVLSQLMARLKKINNWLKEHINPRDTRNHFIFVENNYKTHANPGSGYDNNKDFVQVVGINKDQAIDKALMRTFTHEYVHKIIGCTIRFKPENYSKEWWFKEGFVDFLTSQILLETNIWNIEDYMNFYNERIYKYFAFGMNKYKLSDMYKPMYEEAGYIAGMLYAAKLNELIISNSNGSKSMSDFIADFQYLFINDANLYFSESLFEKKWKEFIQAPFPSIQKVLDTNSLISPKLLSGKLSIKSKKMQLPKYEHDFYELVSTMRLNNKNIIAIMPSSTDPYVLNMKLIDDENNKIEEFTLKPNYKTETIPQYELSPNKIDQK